jgi:pyridinium-3,5-bisthiocarboxylic acid mononucleotide nickel chelatase
MKTLYLDIFSGISGDMFIGAMLDLGLDQQRFQGELQKLGLEGYHIHIGRGSKASIAGIKFDVHVTDDLHEESSHHEHGHAHAQHSHSHSHRPEAEITAHETHEHHHPAPVHSHAHAHAHEHGRSFSQIRQLIAGSQVSPWVKEKSVAVFQRIAVAEGKIHGLPAEAVHFHEVGAIDSIVDIVGACVALELLEKPRVLAGPVVEGTGWIDCAHGRFPIPAPATLEILATRGIPISQSDEPHELVTPTGAALLAEFVERFGPMQQFAAEKIGFGLGHRDNDTRPNVLRVILGEAAAQNTAHDWQTDTVAVLEANVDDLNPEILGYFSEKALAAGALDVFCTPIQMKKNRPGTLLTILCAETEADRFAELMLRETSTFGVRRSVAERRKIARESVAVQTPFGEVSVKLGKLDGRIIQTAPEFESCRRVAETAKVPLREVYEAAIRSLPTAS